MQKPERLHTIIVSQDKEREVLTNRFHEEPNDRFNGRKCSHDQLDRSLIDVFIIWKRLKKKLNLRKHYIDVIECAFYRLSDFCGFLDCLLSSSYVSTSLPETLEIVSIPLE